MRDKRLWTKVVWLKVSLAPFSMSAATLLSELGGPNIIPMNGRLMFSMFRMHLIDIANSNGNQSPGIFCICDSPESVIFCL